MTQAERLAETRARILETADRLFYGQGIRAVGVDTIAAEAGLSKRTLYNHFPSKEALILAYLERRFRIAEASDAPPLEQIRRYFERLEHSIAAPGFRGCPFVNAVAELGEEGRAATDVARRFKTARNAFLRSLVAQLAVDDPEGLSQQLGLLVEGAVAAALVHGSAAPARVAGTAALALIAAAERRAG